MSRLLSASIRATRLATAVLVFGAVAVQFAHSVIEQGRPAGNFLSFFTIQSNVIAAALLGWLSLRPDRAVAGRVTDRLRVCAVLYLSVTGVVYGILLSDVQEQLQVTIPWVDTVLHTLVPLLVFIDWIVDPPTSALTFRRALIALVFPIGWLGYTLLRGAVTGWYPYPFLDPAQPGGYPAVAAYVLVITLGATLMLWCLVFGGRKIADRRGRATTTLMMVAIAVAGGLCGCSPVRAPAADATKSVASSVDVNDPLAFVDVVWRVVESSSVAPGHLYVFLSDGTLVVTSPRSTPSLGAWRRTESGMVMVEQGLEYRVDILGLSRDEFRIRVHDPGEGVLIRFAPAAGRPIGG